MSDENERKLWISCKTFERHNILQWWLMTVHNWYGSVDNSPRHQHFRSHVNKIRRVCISKDIINWITWQYDEVGILSIISQPFTFYAIFAFRQLFVSASTYTLIRSQFSHLSWLREQQSSHLAKEQMKEWKIFLFSLLCSVCYEHTPVGIFRENVPLCHISFQRCVAPAACTIYFTWLWNSAFPLLALVLVSF